VTAELDERDATAPRHHRVNWRAPQAWRQRTPWFPTDMLAGQILRGARWSACALWLILFVRECYYYGVPFDRTGLLVWIGGGLLAASIGYHPIWLLWVAVDFLPLAAVLIVYDYLRGLSESLGMPVWWHPQIDVDKFLFLGTEPTVWLQEHLKHPDVRWYDVGVCICYYSFFFLPYVTAGALWLRGRADFYRWTLRFVGLSFFAFTLFALIPAAPPWAAAHCTAAQVADHPSSPGCMYLPGQLVPSGGLLGPMTSHLPGANPWVEQLAGRGFYKLHLGVANSLLSEGRAIADAVAAVPSLHLGGTVLFVLFMWRRVSKWWRPVLVAYPFAMTFTLVYAGEHYVSDCIAGALAAVLVHVIANRIERRRRRAGAVDTLGDEHAPVPSLETQCPPTVTTPSSI
jgi:hypothetical protein